MAVRDELIVTESLTPVIRAGAMNAFLIIMAFFLILLAQAPLEPIKKYPVIAVAVVIVGIHYWATVSRIIVSETGLRIICSVHQVDIPFSAIQKASLTTFVFGVTMWLCVWGKGRRLPNLFRIADIATSWGDFRQTEQRLRQVLGDYLKKDSPVNRTA